VPTLLRNGREVRPAKAQLCYVVHGYRQMRAFPAGRGISGKGLTLASGGRFSAHADCFNAWDERVLVRLVDACFHGRPCNPAGLR
jgi:hypothetical protein